MILVVIADYRTGSGYFRRRSAAAKQGFDLENVRIVGADIA